jgi:hypothetical protein
VHANPFARGCRSSGSCPRHPRQRRRAAVVQRVLRLAGPGPHGNARRAQAARRARAAWKVSSAEKRLEELQDGLASFHDDLLGLRRERLAPLIEDVYTITKKAGVRPDTVSYGEDGQEGGIQRLGLTFSVNASYAVVKGVLAAFEKNPQFLILDGVSVSTNDEQPDLLNVNLSVIHYFRDEKMNRSPQEHETAPGRALRSGLDVRAETCGPRLGGSPVTPERKRLALLFAALAGAAAWSFWPRDEAPVPTAGNAGPQRRGKVVAPIDLEKGVPDPPTDRRPSWPGSPR